MVRRSALVYDLLRTEQPQDGFSEKEIVEQISGKHDIVPGKGLRRQVAVALRRGLDFGILTKRNNKFRFDLNNSKNVETKRVSTRKKKRVTRKVQRSGRTKRRQSSSRAKSRNNRRQVPRPKLPNPPSWTPKRRNLTVEQVSKVKKHA